MPVHSQLFIRRSVPLLLAALFASPSTLFAEPPHVDHGDLSYYVNAVGEHVPIRTVHDWLNRRDAIRAGMEEVMGPFFSPYHSPAPVTFGMEISEEHQEGGYIRRKLAYHTDGPSQWMHAWLLIPSTPQPEGTNGSAANNKRPAVLCLHQTTPNGKDSPVGLTDRPALHYAKELAKRGYVTLSPDYPSFGESKDYNFVTDDYSSGTMKAIYDNSQAIDLLQSLPEVDPDRIGCIGHSLGGHNALFTAVFDTRIKAVVTSCGFTTFHKYKGGNLTGWTSPRYMPLIKTKYDLSPDKMPFDFPEVIAAIAPRAIFVNAPLHDDNFDVVGVRDALTAARPIFKLLDASDNLQAVHPDCAHDFLDTERQQAYDFLDHHLKHQSSR